MAFFLSLLAYLGSFAGIVLAFAMSYAVLVAPPREPAPGAPHAAVAAAPAAPASPATSGAEPAVKSKLRYGRLAEGEPASARARSGVRRKVATNSATQTPRAAPPDPRNYDGLWAYQQPPERGGPASGLGYAAEPGNGQNRAW